MSRLRPANDALEARVATRLVGALAAAQPALAPDAAERLRFARQAALERARSARAAPQRRPALAMPARGGLAFGGPGRELSGAPFGAPVPGWQRAAALLPLLLLLAGLIGIGHWARQEQIHNAAAIDAALLADDLPPEAYADPGFAEFLRSEPAPVVP
jgi:hypothetical protein